MNDPIEIGRVYLELADRHAPGLVEGLYLSGSVALGDYVPGRSDVDFVAVTAAPPDPAAVRKIHAELREKGVQPDFDGPYVGWSDLAGDPDLCPPGPHVLGKQIRDSVRNERHLVTWHMLKQGGVAVRGPEKPEIYTDWEKLAAFTENNLRTYWRRWTGRSARSFSLAGAAGLLDARITWGVLGATRLRHTLAAGEVTSKGAAGAWALGACDERWHRIVREGLRIRRGEPNPLYRSRFARRRDMIDYLRMVLTGN
ncbi:aminoglycoside adenylyltransferase domain-containing protein [Nonomuraea typhae]|uniref:Aminoglycoside adenylyltransferase domain-containing protein n=1 Tax=Nonomuraea typhae TaxID=2603600 RepID=A0ABW7YND1_9ACTN